MLPRQGVSVIDREGQPFDSREARQALFDSVRNHVGQIEVIELDAHINETLFAESAARKLIELMERQSPFATESPRR